MARLRDWLMQLFLSPLILLLLAGPVWAEEFIATGYDTCLACCGKTDGITASGRKATPGRTVAVNWLPFGTPIWINGTQYIVEDRGAISHFGSKKNRKKRVDICFATHQEALEFGRRKVNVVYSYLQ